MQPALQRSALCTVPSTPHISCNLLTDQAAQMADDNTELFVAIAALVISVLAFFIALLQALQQYFITATGFSSCSEDVIGKWAKFARRQMRWSEFRFEVQFEVPVIFVAPPENQKGPLGSEKDKAIIRLDGSNSNDAYITTQRDIESEGEKTQSQLVHTADNEKATWCELLTKIYEMEKKSREWQQGVSAEDDTMKGPPRSFATNIGHHIDRRHDLLLETSSLVVCMQSKRRTWDSMPEGVKKPYATTTISHLVEIAAMLGIHWKKFDLNADSYRAQGNGLVLYGSYVDHLGITFTFQKQGPNSFGKNRVIPNNHVKRFCFGMPPTIFKEKSSMVDDVPKDIESLRLGSLEEIAQTLQTIGCHINAVNTFRKSSDDMRHSHIFPGEFFHGT